MPSELVSVLDLIGRYGIIPALFVWALLYIKSEHALNRKESKEREQEYQRLINGALKETMQSINSTNQLMVTMSMRIQEDYRNLAEANRLQREEHKDHKEKVDEISSAISKLS